MYADVTAADPKVSIRSPRRNEGRRAGTGAGAIASQVSIRSPRRNEGRLRRLRRVGGSDWFQSAPPAETRGDIYAYGSTKSPFGFNPLPPPKRGETGRWRSLCPLSTVSIRSPRRNEGRPRIQSPHLALSEFQSAPPAETRGDGMERSPARRRELFQSAPPAETRGDSESGAARLHGICFNPLPPPKRGETQRPLICSIIYICFNPLPPPKRGETY